MLPDFLVSMAGGLIIAAALGYWFGLSRDSTRRLTGRFRDFSERFPKRSGKAVSAYLREAEKERRQPQAAFELAAYFRSGGDWRRALQIHEALAARPDLDAATRAQAGLEIGEDYRSAGMLDRAEEAYARTAEFLPLRLKALTRQLDICEQLSAWERAVDIAERVRREDASLGSKLRCQYLCELALEAMREGDIRRARSCWRRAARGAPESARPLVDRAVLDGEGFRKGLTLAGNNPQCAVLILLGLAGKPGVAEGEFKEALGKQLAAAPGLGPSLASALLMAPELLCASSAECLFAALHDKLPAYGKMYAAGSPAEFCSSSLKRLMDDLKAATGGSPGWRCASCGQQEEKHSWRCKECGAWEAGRLVSPLAPGKRAV